jgi:glutathione peroxidase
MLFLFHFLFGPPAVSQEIPANIYDFKVAALDGSTIDISQYKGKKIMIVNTASRCGYTPQYAALEKLYEEHKDKMVIIGFPANNFLFQEPGSNEQIATFCKKNYGVTFPLAAKISVKGRRIAPIYKWLTQKKYNNFKESAIKWNFQKFLIDEQGQLIDVFDPATPPNSPEVIRAIEK